MVKVLIGTTLLLPQISLDENSVDDWDVKYSTAPYAFSETSEKIGDAEGCTGLDWQTPLNVYCFEDH